MRSYQRGKSIVWDFNPKHDKVSDLSKHISSMIQFSVRRGRPVIFLCIGTDTVVGDTLGPLVGTRLSQLLHSDLQVYGTLDKPVDASNIHQTVKDIKSEFEYPLIIAVDAALSTFPERAGLVTFSRDTLQPGAAIRDDLPEVGDFAICGVVLGGPDVCLSSNTVRLSDVMMQADFIAKGLYRAYHGICSRITHNQTAV